MGRRSAPETVRPEIISDDLNGESSAEPHAPLTSAQRLSASAGSSTEVSPDPFGREAKHFTEFRVLNREVTKFLYLSLYPLHLLRGLK